MSSLLESRFGQNTSVVSVEHTANKTYSVRVGKYFSILKISVQHVSIVIVSGENADASVPVASDYVVIRRSAERHRCDELRHVLQSTIQPKQLAESRNGEYPLCNCFGGIMSTRHDGIALMIQPIVSCWHTAFDHCRSGQRKPLRPKNVCLFQNFFVHWRT